MASGRLAIATRRVANDRILAADHVMAWQFSSPQSVGEKILEEIVVQTFKLSKSHSSLRSAVHPSALRRSSPDLSLQQLGLGQVILIFVGGTQVFLNQNNSVTSGPLPLIYTQNFCSGRTVKTSPRPLAIDFY